MLHEIILTTISGQFFAFFPPLMSGSFKREEIMPNKLTYEEVKQRFEERGYELLSTKYIDCSFHLQRKYDTFIQVVNYINHRKALKN